MNRWLLVLALLIPAAQARALEAALYYLGNHTYNDFWPGFQDGHDSDGFGLRLSHEFVENWHARLSIDSIGDEKHDWDPTGHRHEDNYDYGWPSGEIRSSRSVTWIAANARYDLLPLSWPEAQIEWRTYLCAGLATVPTEIELTDNYTGISGGGSFFGHLAGGGTELIILGPVEHDRRLSIFVEAQRREFRPHYDVGTGFRARTDISATFIAGVGWYFF